MVANFVLTDEINRAPAKVQSALLEVMAERHVSIGGKTFPMPDPFLVMATQNPIENEGVYPLPEAQRDRFLFKLLVGYPEPDEEREIVYRMGVDAAGGEAGAADRANWPGCSRSRRDVFVHHALVDYVVRLVFATRTPAEHGLTDVAGWLVLRRVAARLARHHRRRPGAGAGPRPRLRRPAGRHRRRRRTCCGTGWCCPTTRWPTGSRSSHPRPAAAGHPAAAGQPAGGTPQRLTPAPAPDRP